MASSSQIDSDEDEVMFWGPVTMKEIKASLRIPKILNAQATTKAVIQRQEFNEIVTNGSEKEEFRPVEIQSRYADTSNVLTSPEKCGNNRIAPTPSKATVITQLDKENDDSPNLTPQSSPIKDNDTSAYTTPSLMSPAQNGCDSSFASVTSSFVDESESPALDVASESFEKVDPKRYNAGTISDIGLANKVAQDSKEEKILDEVSPPTNISNCSFCGGLEENGNIENLSTDSKTELTNEENREDVPTLKEKLSEDLGVSLNLEVKNRKPSIASPVSDNAQISLKPLNFSQLTEVNISFESPPNLTLLDDTVLSVNQSRLSTRSNFGLSSKLPEKKIVKGLSNLPTLVEKLPQKKYFGGLSAPKVYATKQKLNVTPAEKMSAVVTPSTKEPKKLEAASATRSIKSTLFSSDKNKLTPLVAKTPSKTETVTSDSKRKFFSPSPSVRSLHAPKFKPGAVAVNSKSNHPLPYNPAPSPQKNGGKTSAEPKKKFFLAPHLSKIPCGPTKLEIPKSISPKFRSNLNATKTSVFSKNNSPVSASKIPAMSIPKFFPSYAKKTVQNKENLSVGTPNGKDLESPASKYSSDSSLPLSDASFNSSLNSNKSLVSGIPIQKSVVDSSKSLVKARLPLPRFKDTSRIPKVNFTPIQKTGK